jgi:V/A-type H+-transporting ATPase subunit B
MKLRAPVEYSTVSSIHGPLLVVEGIEDVGWDEVAEIRLASGELRHGVVLDVQEGLAVVQVFEGTASLRTQGLRVAFAGTPLRVPVGEGWLGRVCNGRGEPLDGGPPVTGSELREVGGRPINPAARATPRDPILTGVSAVDGLATLVRGQKLPVFSLGGRRTSSSPPRSPRRRGRRASRSPSSSPRSASPTPTRTPSATRSRSARSPASSRSS